MNQDRRERYPPPNVCNIVATVICRCALQTRDINPPLMKGNGARSVLLLWLASYITRWQAASNPPDRLSNERPHPKAHNVARGRASPDSKVDISQTSGLGAPKLRALRALTPGLPAPIPFPHVIPGTFSQPKCRVHHRNDESYSKMTFSLRAGNFVGTLPASYRAAWMARKRWPQLAVAVVTSRGWGRGGFLLGASGPFLGGPYAHRGGARLGVKVAGVRGASAAAAWRFPRAAATARSVDIYMSAMVRAMLASRERAATPAVELGGAPCRRQRVRSLRRLGEVAKSHVTCTRRLPCRRAKIGSKGWEEAAAAVEGR